MLVRQGGITRSSPIMRYLVEYSSSCFPIADVFGLTKLSIEFSVLHPSQSRTRVAWRRRVATRSRPASPALYRTELRDLAAAGRRVTTCIEEELDLERPASIHS
ncbi:hypothetical protein BGZ61DRAFT_469864 [Ilyonectria robusta]|uniref:uncharacterized protein n=1 Tax=Ilyonectria robusta TaxID=1079257 RepID=UPI001E8CEDC5|nr:uncharacterized protein BGZ61DRAFT_469864 [Ilyonectria robusta]KAH8647531.1 hypothetical protein BGZ61DRAFT_469864 [Ilyonectria robusta]